MCHATRLLVLGLTFLVVSASMAPAEVCNPQDASDPCRTRSGTYYARTPDDADPHLRHPVVLLLHDAGRSGEELVNDRRLQDAIVGRGYALLAPNATRRKYVRSGSRVEGYHSETSPWKSDRMFVLEAPDGTVRELRSGRDRGWYFANVDVKVLKTLTTGLTEVTPLGRNESDFVREVLLDAAERFQIDTKRIIIIGLGHGGSLAWQLACRSPLAASLYAPVDGAYWMDVPRDCSPGVKLVHTHSRKSSYWPLDGAPQTAKLFARTAIRENLSMLARANGCDPTPTRTRLDADGADRWTWPHCRVEANVELLLLDEPFAFQDWWLGDVLDRFGGQRTGQPAVEETSRPRPEFKKPKFPISE